MDDIIRKIDNQIDRIEEIQNLRQQKYFDWLKNILTIAVAFLGLIISLKSENDQSFYKHIFFSITILLLSIGILFGSIVLYSEVHLLNRLRNRRVVYLRGLEDGNNESYTKIHIPPHKFYIVSEYICYASFGLSLCSLVIYSFL